VEYGSISRLRIFGVELLNQGSGLSIDDIINWQQLTHMATYDKNKSYYMLETPSKGQSAGKSILG